MLEPPRPYMAVSHVWSDGTGTGAWRDGEVNECLYLYFRAIAEHFQCEGIWWDALCIPRAKAARNKAIQKIQTNYQDARITLVHDCFLRNWDWDPETACFGILMSPWFSRGWTALELAKSRKVKVIFKGRYGPVIKDLDEEILAKADEINVPRIKASRMIRNLRKEFTSLNDLLTVLRPRFTSWPKDMAVISALLVGIEPEERQQKTYRSILKKLGELCPENLFHNAATMSDEFSWCPTSLFKMPLERSSEVRLKILGNDIRGKWRISRHYVEAGLEKNCIWHSSHPLITRQLQDVLKCPRRCRLLTKCGTEPVQRALLVRERHWARYQYLGALYFRQELRAWSTDDWIEEDVTICGIQGDDGLMRHPGQDRSARDAECTNLSKYHQDERSDHALDVENLKHAVWRGEYYPAFSEMMGRVDLEIPDCLGRRLLHLAAERGDKRCVESLLASNVDTEARCHNGQTALYLASWGGSASVVRSLLDQHSDVTAKDNYGNTALHIAARMGFESIVRLLIEKKIPVNAEGHNSLTPLHYATMNGHKAVVELLLREGAKVNVKDSKIGWVPLHCAAESGDEDLAELLIKSGADVNVTDSIVGWNPLHFAAMNGHKNMMHLLVRQGANSKAKDMYGWMPQQFAVLNGHGHLGIVELSSSEGETSPFADKGRLTPIHCIAINRQRVLHKLLDGNGTDIDFSSSKENWSPMLFAIQNGLSAVINLLLETSATIEAEEGTGRTPLCWAALEGNYTAAKLLLEKGAKIEAKDRYGHTPLHCAAQEGHESVVSLLLEKGANYYVGGTPLCLAALKGHVSVSTLLLERGANIEAGAHRIGTPLCLAARGGHETAVTLLLEKGANIEEASRHWGTPLVCAAENGHVTVLTLLLERGANTEAREYYNRTPLHFAIERGDENIVRLLLEKGAIIETADRFSGTPICPDEGYKTYKDWYFDMGQKRCGKSSLRLAAEMGHVTIVKLLLEKGTDTKAMHRFGQSLLCWAIAQAHWCIVELLLNKGISIDARDPSGQTPLRLAIENGHERIVELLLEQGANQYIGQLRGHIRKGTSIEATDTSGQSLLCSGVTKGQETVVKHLLQKSTNTKARANLDKAPLYPTAQKNETVVGLLQKGRQH
ncbi:ankyrin repeat domain-containing protein [Aspergillus udagawae]|uniref:Heterokaryon incompatibility domain-containing protein n=1 Tax=Aspergillus udagawae TaxID=91492 RepID=A0A8E0QU86_9EURO|nr:uncharacterized protein Aud_005864 [Aspergillus udagawae]GIC89449.1 hypothetical protein Aud_005864 [Aspergillus udagawae]